MNPRLPAALVFLIPAFGYAVETYRLPVNSETIPEITTRSLVRYSKVQVTNRTADRVSFRHESGASSVALADFDDRNLNLLFPGFQAKKEAEEAAEAEKRNTKLVDRFPSHDESAAAVAKIKEAVSEELRNPDFKCILVSGHDTYRYGEVPCFIAQLVNKSDHEIHLLGALEGSVAFRFPLCHYVVTDANGQPAHFELIGNRCGNLNRLRAEDFATVAPGEAFSPFGKDFFGDPPFYGSHPLPPGTYTVRFIYSTTSTDIWDYFGDERIGKTKEPGINAGLRTTPEILRLFQGISHFEVKSNEVKITFLPKDK